MSISFKSLDKSIVKSVEFYDKVNRLSFMYGLNVEEMLEAIKCSIDQNGDLNYEVLNISSIKEFIILFIYILIYKL